MQAIAAKLEKYKNPWNVSVLHWCTAYVLPCCAVTLENVQQPRERKCTADALPLVLVVVIVALCSYPALHMNMVLQKET